MQIQIDWQNLAAMATILSVVYGLIRNFRKDIDNKLFKVQEDITEIKERMSFLEAANIYTMPLEPSKPNARSLAAKEMHRRRRVKKLEEGS